MKTLYPNFTVTELCHLFEVSSSSFYYEPKIPTVENENLYGEIKRIFTASGQTYGKRRIQAELKGLGHQIGTHKIANIMKLNQLVAIRPTKKHYYPSSGNEHRYAPNLLKRQFSPEQHNHYYVGGYHVYSTSSWVELFSLCVGFSDQRDYWLCLINKTGFEISERSLR